MKRILCLLRNRDFLIPLIVISFIVFSWPIITGSAFVSNSLAFYHFFITWVVTIGILLIMQYANEETVSENVGLESELQMNLNTSEEEAEIVIEERIEIAKSNGSGGSVGTHNGGDNHAGKLTQPRDNGGENV